MLPAVKENMPGGKQRTPTSATESIVLKKVICRVVCLSLFCLANGKLSEAWHIATSKVSSWATLVSFHPWIIVNVQLSFYIRNLAINSSVTFIKFNEETTLTRLSDR